MLHEDGHTFVAEEGPYSASTSNLPVLQVGATSSAQRPWGDTTTLNGRSQPALVFGLTWPAAAQPLHSRVWSGITHLL
jgi:hypothetical protein